MPTTSNAAGQLRVIAVGQIPPPVTGYAYITTRMIEMLSENSDVKTINISPGNRRGLRKHVHKTCQTARACWQIANNSTRLRLVYLGCEGDWGLIYTIALVLSSSLSGHRILLHHHSFSYIDRPSALMRAVLVLGGKALQHIFLCATMRDRFESRYCRIGDSYIISNAAFVAALPNTSTSPVGPIRMGLLSNLTREKGLHTFVHLMRVLRASNLDVEGLLAGPIASDEDKAMVEAAEGEFGSALRYLGPVYGEAKNRFYSEIDVFVFATEYANEAQPTVLFEALAAGNSIIAFDRGCIGAQIGSNGIAIPAGEDFCGRARDYIMELITEHSDRVARRHAILRDFNDTQVAALCSVEGLVARWANPPSNSYSG